MSYLRAMKFNQQSVRSFYLRTHKQKLPAFTVSSENHPERKGKRKGGVARSLREYTGYEKSSEFSTFNP
ncbi:hypothetical protein QBE54_07695 [Thermatribacter velox]|jgi:hypothetical protein|uniref:Uncharacterized protein n=1 Tax=Thermatribacter velox TaxID=3039681 RepID=A0ABZ2Y8X9_9BACT